jgi:rhamnulose-1-phosphate aldolase
VALSIVPRFRRDPSLLDGLLHRAHTEAALMLPRGIAYVGVEVPGGTRLADLLAAALERSDLALLSHHGVFAAGDTVDEAFDRIEYGNKAATLFFTLAQRNLEGSYLDEHELRTLKHAYGLGPRA